MGVTGIGFGIVTDPVLLMSTGLIFNLLVNLFTPVIVLYAAELFTTDRRAQGTSWGWASNRIGAALVPLALLPLLQHQGPLAMFAVIAGTLIAFIAVVVVFGPRGEGGPGRQLTRFTASMRSRARSASAVSKPSVNRP